MATLSISPTSGKCKNFNFSLYTVPAEMLYLQKYLTNFQKLFFWLKDDEGGYCCLKFQVHWNFGFPMATVEIFQHPGICKNFIFFPLHCPGRNAISSKVFKEFSKTLSFGRTMRKVTIVVENFNCTEILVLP